MSSKRRSGLGSLIPGAELVPDSSQDTVEISNIVVNPYQPRMNFDESALADLTASIKQYGILQPLSVRHNGVSYELIAGERRWQAAKRAGLQTVPVVIRECTDEEMLALALVENIQRENLNAIEAARSYKQLTEQFGLTQHDVADKVGKSRTAVANTMRLLALPVEMQSAIEEGKISEGHGRALLSIDDAERRKNLFTVIKLKGLSVREAEAIASIEPKVKKDPKKIVAIDANMDAVKDELQSALGTRVKFRQGSSAGKGVIEIDYFTQDDLERIYEVIVKK
jgi:ParB family chromosome partitioning protein